MSHSRHLYELQRGDEGSATRGRKGATGRRGGLKTGAAIAALAAGVFIAAYFGWTAGDAEVDSGVSAMQIEYHCSRCGHNFELTVAKSAQARRDRGDITCPKCEATGATKKDVSVVVSGEDAPNSQDRTGEAEETEDSAQGARPTATRTGG